MHELSLCQSVLDTVLEELKKLDPPAKVTKVRVVVGRQHQVIPDNMIFLYETVAKDTPADGSTMELIQRPITARCKVCNWDGEIAPPLYACGACGSSSLLITGGKELYVESMEVERDD